MKKIGVLMMAAICYFGAVETTTYAKSSGEERTDRIEDIADIFRDDDDKDGKHKKHPGNSKNGRDNHGQNKKK